MVPLKTSSCISLHDNSACYDWGAFMPEVAGHRLFLLLT